jgi:hypothetical protein
MEKIISRKFEEEEVTFSCAAYVPVNGMHAHLSSTFRDTAIETPTRREDKAGTSGLEKASRNLWPKEKMEPPRLELGVFLTLSGSASNRRCDKRKQIRYQRLRGTPSVLIVL